ncbi:MAG: FimD/PapC C-terminal domain-containing protein [Enterobacter hormaechei]
MSYIRFETDKRQSWVLHATRADGKPLPFGTEVLDEHGGSVGYVGQASVLYIRAEQPPRAQRISAAGSAKSPPSPGAEQPSSVCH